MAGQVDLNAFPDFALSGVNPQMMLQLEAKLKAMLYEWSDAFINGVAGTSTQFLGIDAYVGVLPAAQSLSSGVAAGAFSTANAKQFMNELDIVMHKVRGGPDFILMNDPMIRFFLRSSRE